MKKLLIIYLILCFVVSPVWGATKYLSFGGSGDGSACNNAWSVSTHNGQTFSAGDIIVLCDDGGSVYNDVELIPPSSGSDADTMITYQPESGASITISAYHTVATSCTGWSEYSGTTYQRNAPGDWEVEMIKDGALLPKGQDSPCEDGLADGEYCWDTSGSPDIIYYRTDSGNPNSTDEGLQIAGKSNAIDIDSKNYVMVKDITVQGGWEGGEHGALEVQSCTGCVIENVTVHAAFMAGIMVNGGESVTVRQSTVYDCHLQGIGFYGGTTSFTAHNNTIYNIAQVDTGSADGHGIGVGGNTPNCDTGELYDNEIYGCGNYSNGAAIAVHESDTVKVYQNNIHDNHNAGISIGASTDGGYSSNSCEVYMNRIANNGLETSPSATVNYNPIWAQAYYAENTFNNLKIYDNTIVMDRMTEGSSPAEQYKAAAISLFTSVPNVTGIEVKNNIVYIDSTDTGYIIMKTDAAGAGSITLTSDHNDLHRTGGTTKFRFEVADNTLAEWRTNGYDTVANGSIVTDPLFVDVANNNFNLKSTSPAINAGASGLGVTRDLEDKPTCQGAGCDIGCYEYDEMDPRFPPGSGFF